MNKLLITGADGFIGKHILPHLTRERWEIHAVCHRNSHPDTVNLKWHHLNLLESEKSAALVKKIQPSHLLHLAWFHEGQSYWESPENEKWVLASLELARSFIESGGIRLVVAGTCAEEMQPLSPYGRAKAELYEQLHELIGQTPATLGWGQIYFPYGPHQDSTRLIPSLLQSLRRGEKAKCNNPSLIRDYIYVEDVALVFCKLLEKSVQGKVQIGTGIGITLREIATKTAEILGSPNNIEFGSGSPKDFATVVANTKRLKEDLGFNVSTDLSVGIRRTILEIGG